ncbi:MAG TPA: HAMP domain-containing sensor histidine kinase [Acidimicrobiia bacterium]|jgi:signal transduction histidine kinase
MRPLGLRGRLVATLIAVVALTVLVVGVTSVFLVDRSLRNRLVDEVIATTEFNLTVLLPATGIVDPADSEALEQAGVIDRFLRRGTTGAWVELDDGSRVAGGLAPLSVSRQLTDIAERGEIGYEFTEAGDQEVVVSAARLPPSGPVFYFVTPAQVLSDTTRQLVVVVSVAGSIAIAVGALAGTAAARRILRPVAAAREAAERMAGGDLDVRLPVESDDELGRLSASFNHMAASLQATIAELDAARARERRFVADVSHELRTPLTGLVNEAQMLSRRLGPGSEVTDDVRTLASLLDADVARLRHLVEDLLEISRLDSDREPASTSPTDVTALLAALIAERHPEAVLDSDLTAPVPVDGRALERIVANLLDNARLHAPGAETTVTARRVGDSLEVAVADRGPGVPPEHLERIFERFSTVDSARSSGTGLGLAIVRQHATRIGGHVEAFNREGGGLAVVVRIPVAELLHGGEADENSVSDSGVEASTEETK